jgi:uncharacterized membrane protein YccC
VNDEVKECEDVAGSTWRQTIQRLSTRSGAPDPRQRQYTLLTVLAVAICTVAGWLFKLEAPAIIAGLAAVFALVAAGGRSLRSDVRRLSWLAPALIVVMGGGPLLAHIPLVAGILVALVVFGAGMLPAFGEHYRASGQCLAAAALTSTTTGLGSNQPAIILFPAAVAGVLFALGLRVVIGLGDTNRYTRFAVARALVESGPGIVEHAAASWRSDGCMLWLGQALGGAARFRAARETLLAQAQHGRRHEGQRLRNIVTEADEIAAELATAMRARACTGLPPRAREDPAEVVLRRGGRQDLPEAVHELSLALERIREAVLTRSTSVAPPPTPGAWRQRVRGALRAHLSLRSSLFRHALRCTLAVIAGLVIVSLLNDPTASSLLLGLFLVLAPAARDSAAGALERTGGLVLGVVALAVLITLLPGAFLLVPLVVAAMLLNVQRLRSDYQLLLAALIAVTVVDQAMELHRALVNVAIGFAANTAIGAAIALTIGYLSYVVLPGSVEPDVDASIRATVWSVSELLRSLRAASRGEDLRQALESAYVLALRRTQDLLGLPALLDGADGDNTDEKTTRDAAVALDALLQDLAALVFRPEQERGVVLPTLSTVDDLLSGRPDTHIPELPPGSPPEAELLASSLVENALHARAAIDHTLGTENPWKTYTISFVRPERLRIR